jgi:ABC-type iron transport system FetAB permease component
MDPASIASIIGFVNTGLVAFKASDQIMRYWQLVSAGLPLGITIAEDAYKFTIDRILPIMDMIKNNREPTADEWHALDNDIISLMAKLHEQASK